MSSNDMNAATIWKEARNQKYQCQQLLEDLSSNAYNYSKQKTRVQVFIALNLREQELVNLYSILEAKVIAYTHSVVKETDGKIRDTFKIQQL